MNETANLTGQEMNLLFDVAWHRVVVRKLTGSFAGFFVVPSCTLALSLIVATTVLQAVVYSCSRGELQMLEILGGSLEVDFVKWQDRFTVQSDASYRQAFLVATADSYGRSLDFEPPEEHHAREQDSGSQRLISKVNLIRLQEMKIPRVANISVQGLRQSQAGMTYSVQFATARKLPVFLQISHPRSGFRRCFPWGALVDSEMSMPPLANSGLKVSVVLADYVVGPPYTRQTTDQMEAAGLDATWTTFETFQSMHCEPSDLQCCKQLCVADPNCLETLLGEGGCYFASHNHSLQSDLCEKALNTTGHRKKTGQAAEEAFRITLHGCIGKRGNGGASSLCGSVGLDEGERMVDFGEISPDWKGGLRASLWFEMTPSTGSLQVPVERQTIELRRDMPMVMDVLVYLGGRPRKSPEEFVPLTTRGSVTDDGNIKVHVSKYEPLDFSALELVLVPILPDRRFRVHWASLPGDAADAGQGVLPRFARCEESLLLQQRYKACGGPGAWDSQPVSLNVSRWFTGFMPKFFVAPADDAEASAGRWISKPELQDVSIDFNGSDKPVAWLAKTLGCNLFDIEPMEYKEVAIALPKSADAQCELLAKGCMKSHKSLMCSNILASLKPEGWLGQGIDSSDLLQLLGCFKNASMGKKVCSDPDVDVPWFGPFQWRPEEKNFEIVFRNYVMDSHLRHGVEISEKELFSSIARIAVQHAEINFWTGFLAEVREICLSDVHRGRSAYQHQHALSWLLNSLRTGSLDFIRHIIKECLEDVSTQLKHEDFRAASAAAWQGIRLQEPVAHFNASALLIGVAEILGGHMTQGLVEAAVISGHNIEEPEAMDTFLEARKTDVLKLNFGLDTASAVTDLGPILKKTSELRELHVACWRCGPGQDMPVGVLEDNGFFLSLGKLSKLRLLEMPAFSMPAPVVQGFVAALQGIKLDKLYLHGYDRPSFESKFLKLFAPLCVRWLEVASFLFTSRDALEVVRAFNSSNEPSAWGCLTKLRFEELYRFPEDAAV